MGKISDKTKGDSERHTSPKDITQQNTTLGQISQPKALAPNHDCSKFSSGESILDTWLKKYGSHNAEQGYSAVFVCTDKNDSVVGYYCLSGYIIDKKLQSAKNAPKQIPALLLGRLAVDKNYQGQGLGHDLLKDAMIRAASVSKDAGIHTLVVHAKNEAVSEFYKRFGFDNISANDNLVLHLPIQDIIKNL